MLPIRSSLSCSSTTVRRRARGTAGPGAPPRLSRDTRWERSASRDSLCVALVSERIRPVALGEDAGPLRLGDFVVLSGGPGAVPAVRLRQSLQPAEDQHEALHGGARQKSIGDLDQGTRLSL